ncbi:MAG: hypothetical protein COW23_00765, partial [Hydrogenophilales bacterium CG15_BIG_FIL_POST_REV_8_21_14_020_62_31]
LGFGLLMGHISFLSRTAKYASHTKILTGSTAYLWLDQFFDWMAIFKDLYKRPFITAGMAALLMLAPLALTSNDRSVRVLKRNWLRLHRLVYPAAICGVLHYYWLVKQDVTLPVIYAAVLAVLLGVRLWWRRQKQATKKAG